MANTRNRSTRSRSSSRSKAKPVNAAGKEKDVVSSDSDVGVGGIPNFSLSGTKLISQLVLTSINIFCWYVPLARDDLAQNKPLLSLASCFSGGVFLCLALTHLLPHAVEEMEEAGGDKAITYISSLTGYLLVLFIDKVAFSETKDFMHSNASESAVMTGGGYNSAIVLLIAMGVHSLLETVALGMAKDSASTVMMAASIGLHQPAETLALLVAFLKTGMTKDEVTQFLMLFSIIGPIGVSLGIYLKGIASAKTDALIMALTSGTFIYMGATEMVGEEFDDGTGQEKLNRFIAIICGVVTILVLTRESDKLEAKCA
jgi:zinc transporter ZupT